MKKKRIFKLGELFGGPGGLALGAINAKAEKNNTEYCIKHSWASDYDFDSCQTYIKNICPNAPNSVLCADVKKLNVRILPPIDVFAYGFPCNDFSVVGERKGVNGNFGALYAYGVKVLNIYNPKFFVAENVSGLSSANEGVALDKILLDLRNGGNGYNLTAHKYRFEDYGIPQTRHRIIIVGIDKNLNKFFRVPAPTTLKAPKTAMEALEIPPIPENCPNNERTAQSPNVVERLKYIRAGQNAWNAELPKHLQLNVKKTRLSHIYRRLDPNKPAYTITGSGGGGTHGYHWKENRALTNRERARIQTFPDTFVFEGSKESVRKQIGMAVSPKMAEIIFNAVLKTIASVEYAYIPANLDNQLDLFAKAS